MGHPVVEKNTHAVGLSGPYSGTAGLAARGDIVANAGMVIVSGDTADSCY